MAARNSDFTSTEIRAGVLVLVSLVILVGFVAAIRGCRPRDETAKLYHATFSNIGGLNRGADVRFGGVRVGRIIAIAPDPDERSQIRITAEVAGSVPVNLASVATIEQVTMTAEKHLEISTGESDAALHENGDTLRSQTSGGGWVEIPGIEGIVTRLDLLLDSFIVLMGGTPVGNAGVAQGEDIVDLTEITAALEKTLNESAGVMGGVNSVIAENRQGIDDIITKLAALEEVATELLTEISAVVAENRQPLNATFTNLQKLSEDTGTAVQEIAASLSVTLQHLQDAGGNASGLINDQRPTIEEILLNLQETTRNLKRLSQTLADQPDALLRGARPMGRKNEEKR
ncbi:MAG: MlaD family protein [Thermoanaerobaculales bacterium]